MVETPYEVRFLPAAERELADLEATIAQRMLRKLRWSAENRSVVRPEPLKGSLKGFYKLRVGSYRAIFTIDDRNRLLIVHMIGHRREIYES